MRLNNNCDHSAETRSIYIARVSLSLTFLEKRAAAMGNITSCESTGQSVSKDTPKKPSYIANNIKPITEEPTCKYCHASNHKLFRCEKFKLAAVHERISYVANNKLCTICLNNHQKCRYFFKCGIYKGKHNTLLHNSQPAAAAATNHVSLMSNIQSEVLLPTISVKLQAKNGEHIYARALLDSGSSVNFILKDLAKRINTEFFDEENNCWCVQCFQHNQPKGSICYPVSQQ